MFREIFENIYQQRLWVNRYPNAVSLSGPGSFPHAVSAWHAVLTKYIQQHSIQSVMDFGCGDGAVYDGFDWGTASYRGLDVSATAIELARQRRPQFQFDCAETFDLPRADLLIVKDVFSHWNGLRSTQGLGNQMHRVREFLELNYDKFPHILVVDGEDLSAYFSSHQQWRVDKIQFATRHKILHQKETQA